MTEQSVEKGRLVVISGPSGTGKSTITRRVVALPELRAMLSISMTTRSPRPGEHDGVDYIFHSRDEFQESIERGELLEWAEVHGHFYGTPIRPVERALNESKCVLLEIDVQGAYQVKQRMPEALLVFIHPPNSVVLEERLRSRGTDAPQTIERRLAAARIEIEHAGGYDIQLVNEDLEGCVQQLAQILIR